MDYTQPFILGNWIINPSLNQIALTNDGEQLTLTPKNMQLLICLVEHDKKPISIENLIATVWPQRVVADSSVYQAIAQLRKMLAKDNKQIEYIERISGQGYRIAPAVIIKPTFAQPKKPRLVAVYFTLAIIIVTLSIFGLRQFTTESATPFFENLTLAEHLLSTREVSSIEQAQLLYLQILADDPEQVPALIGLCNSYRLLAIYHDLSELERDNLCQPLLDRAFQLQPKSAIVIAAKARQAFENGEHSIAATLFEQALTITTSDATIWHDYGRLLRNENRIKQALAAHNKAFMLEPNDADILIGLAYAHLNNRDLTQARKYFERSQLVSPQVKNNALYELDFYPLNYQRASNFIAWVDQHQSDYLKKYPAHKLSYSLFLLSIGLTEQAQQTIDSISDIDSLPPHFVYYVKAALAWVKQQPQQALLYLQQRYLLAPSQNHFVMPYLVALVHNQQPEKALTLFSKHFIEVTNFTAEPTEHLGQYLLLAQLYKLTNQQPNFVVIQSKIKFWRQQETSFDLNNEISWQILNEDLDAIPPLLQQLLDQGWLPDVNDNMFAFNYFSSLIKDRDEKTAWQKRVTHLQQCLWQRLSQEACNVKPQD